MSSVLECRAERACFTKWDEKVSYVRPKGKLNHSGLGRHVGGIALFPLNCGLESFVGLAVLPKVCVSVCTSMGICICLCDQAVSMCMHLCTLICDFSVGQSTKHTL